MESFNLFDGALDLERDQPGFSWRAARVGERIGAEQLGASLYELAPGERTFPYHYEYPCEEWLLVVSGRPTLRAACSSSAGRKATAQRWRSCT